MKNLMVFTVFLLGALSLVSFLKAEDVGEGITGNRAVAKPPTAPNMNFDPGPLIVNDKDWLNNNLGKEKTVPEPWTPLVRKDKMLSCWNRDYSFTGLFPSAIRSGKYELLSAPMELIAQIDGETFSASVREVAFTTERPDRIEFTARGDLGPLKVKTKNWIEFDGMVYVNVEIDAGDGIKKERSDLLWRLTHSPKPD
jgi:hypothetical protein